MTFYLRDFLRLVSAISFQLRFLVRSRVAGMLVLRGPVHRLVPARIAVRSKPHAHRDPVDHS